MLGGLWPPPAPAVAPPLRTPIISSTAMVDIAEEVGADAVSHGCTGKGNYQA
ncbi:argininosuccinate synthase chloroplastic [Trifolium pratense]|uniref:Argininosuccinate synthase chloroplastic n=1 Tax=Trifolium pratense TaxID=57577 RepID=A0A2K3JMV6_TRIPR|nr:argininosuccinate synthase chloroplastic [Trifolium pratense]